MVDEAYVKSIEQDNEKLRQKLADTQELLDVAEERLRVANLQDANETYKPLDNEVIDGYRLFNVTDTPLTNTILFTCVAETRSFFGKIRQDMFLFRANFVSTSQSQFSTNLFRYPDGRNLDYSDMEKWKNIAVQMVTVARQNGFMTVGNVIGGSFVAVPYRKVNNQKRFLRNGCIQYEVT